MKSLNSHKQLLKIFSLLSYLFGTRKGIRDFKREYPFAVSEIPRIHVENESVSPITLTAHVYYEEFALELLAKIKGFPSNTNVFVSTSSESIRKILDEGLGKFFDQYQVKVVPNIGRNFAPLFVEFSKELLNVNFFIHVHSKLSIHSKSEFGRAWKEKISESLLNSSAVRRMIGYMEQNDSVGICYGDVSGLIRGINYRWGVNARPARKLIKEHVRGMGLPSTEPFPFPAGGMFLVRTDAITPLLESNWQYSSFEAEKGQVDGTASHALERLVGAMCTSRGYRHVLFSNKNNELELKMVESD